MKEECETKSLQFFFIKDLSKYARKKWESVQRIFIFPAKRSRNIFAELTSVQIGIYIYIFFFYLKGLRTEFRQSQLCSLWVKKPQGSLCGYVQLSASLVAVRHFTGYWSFDAVKLGCFTQLCYRCCSTEASMKLFWLLTASQNTALCFWAISYSCHLVVTGIAVPADITRWYAIAALIFWFNSLPMFLLQGCQF